jgi:hypothetical protein
MLALSLGERGDCFRSIVYDDCAAMRKGVAPKMAGEGNIGQIEFRVRMEVSGKIGNGAVSGRFGFSRYRQELVGRRLAHYDRRWRFFKHNVGVGTANA